MKVSIEPEPYYFGTHRWMLNVVFGRKNKKTKRFFLGQDVKFCSRVLGYEIEDLFDDLKIKKWNQKSSQKLGNFIIRELELTSKILNNLNEWELSAE
jgi:hypothetical protein